MGTSASVLVEKIELENTSFGHTEHFVPVRVKGCGKPGEIKQILITGAGTTMVEGELLHG